MEPEGIMESLDAIVDRNRSASEGLKSRANGVATSTSLVGGCVSCTPFFKITLFSFKINIFQNHFFFQNFFSKILKNIFVSKLFCFLTAQSHHRYS